MNLNMKFEYKIKICKICLSIYISIYLSIHLPINLYIYLTIHPSISSPRNSVLYPAHYATSSDTHYYTLCIFPKSQKTSIISQVGAVCRVTIMLLTCCLDAIMISGDKWSSMMIFCDCLTVIDGHRVKNQYYVSYTLYSEAYSTFFEKFP